MNDLLFLSFNVFLVPFFLMQKQKCRRDELQKKYEKKKKNIILNAEKEIGILSKEMNVMI